MQLARRVRARRAAASRGSAAKIQGFPYLCTGAAFAACGGMDNKTYLIRASSIALLLWTSVAIVLFIARRPTLDAPASNANNTAEIAVAQ